MSASLPWKKQQTFLSICERIFHLTLGLFYPKVDWASDPKVDHKSAGPFGEERCFVPLFLLLLLRCRLLFYFNFSLPLAPGRSHS